MTGRARGLLAALVVPGVLVASVAASRWLNRPETVDGQGRIPASAVILIPGYGGGADGLSGLAGYLRDSGREVLMADIGDGRGDLRAYGAQVSQLAPQSEFLETLRQPGDAGRWLSVYSAEDEMVRPADSSELDGASTVEVTSACATGALDHGTVVRSAAIWQIVAGFLSTGEAPADCSP